MQRYSSIKRNVNSSSMLGCCHARVLVPAAAACRRSGGGGGGVQAVMQQQQQQRRRAATAAAPVVLQVSPTQQRQQRQRHRIIPSAAAPAASPATNDGAEAPSPSSDRRLPVTLLSGFLGAGKTTLLRHVLREAAAAARGLRVAVLVNDMAELNVDAALLADAVLPSSSAAAAAEAAAPGAAAVVAAPESLVALASGCICCTIRGDLVREVRRLALSGAFDYLIIESTGISLPMPVAATFAANGGGGDDDEEEGGANHDDDAAALVAGPAAEALAGLSGVARLDTLVTVVDAERFVAEVLAADGLQERGLGADADDDRTVADLLVEQVETADVLVLNKTDLVPAGEAARVAALLKRLNPRARVIQTSRGAVRARDVLDTGSFDAAALAAAPGWLAELNGFEAELRAARTQRAQQQQQHGSDGAADGGHDHHHHHHHDHDHSHHRRSEADEYGISSFVYYARRPFHPGRLLADALSQTWPGVLRSKGFYWLATRHDVMGLWQSAGGAWQGEPSALWTAAIPEAERPDGWEEDAAGGGGGGAAGAWDPKWGDRCQQLVWIGIGMDEPALRRMLDACLLTDAEMALGPAGWLAAFEDELPPWDDGADGFDEYEDEEEDE